MEAPTRPASHPLDPLVSICRLELTDTAAVLHLSGDWRLDALTRLSGALAQCDLARIGPRALVVEGAALTSLDTAGALLFLRRVVQSGADPASLQLRGFDARHQRIVDVVRERLGGIGTRPPKPVRPLIASFGAHLVELGRLAVTHVGFLGLTLVALASLVRSPGSLRRRELLAQLGEQLRVDRHDRAVGARTVVVCPGGLGRRVAYPIPLPRRSPQGSVIAAPVD